MTPGYHDPVASRPDRRRQSGKRMPHPDPPDLPVAPLEAVGPGEHDLTDEAVYELLAFADVDWSGRDANGAEIDTCTFESVDLSRSRLRRALIRDVRFERCDLANLRVHDSSLTRVAIAASRMTGQSWLDDHLREVSIDGCRMDLSSFRASTFDNVVFSDCRLGQADFVDTDLRGAFITSTDAVALAAILAGALGITIEDDQPSTTSADH